MIKTFLSTELEAIPILDIFCLFVDKRDDALRGGSGGVTGQGTGPPAARWQ